jgi:hypothetical protein
VSEVSSSRRSAPSARRERGRIPHAVQPSAARARSCGGRDGFSHATSRQARCERERIPRAVRQSAASARHVA